MNEENLIEEYNMHMKIYDETKNTLNLQIAEFSAYEIMSLKGFKRIEETYEYIDSILKVVK